MAGLIGLVLLNFLFTASLWAATNSSGINIRATIPAVGGGQSSGSGQPPAPPVDQPPTVSNVASSTSVTTAQVTWSTSDDKGIAGTSFEYGLTTNYGSASPATDRGGGSYRVDLGNLQADTTYFFRISVTDTGNQITRTATSFRTKPVEGDVTVPVISGVHVAAGITTSTITWSTNEPATSEVVYGRSITYESSARDNTFVLEHALGVSNLLPKTTYHYRVFSTDPSGNQAATFDAVFTTRPDSTPPPDVSNLRVTVAGNALAVRWANPAPAAVPDWAGVKLLRKTTGPATTPTDGTLVYNGTGESFNDSAVLANTTYYYTAFSYDTSGNHSPGTLASAKTGSQPKEICNNIIDDDANGFSDCADKACFNNPACQPAPTAEICGNGLDDDGNGKIDCADAACVKGADCQAPATPEICDNGHDDDRNNQTDCADAACIGFSGCAPARQPGGPGRGEPPAPPPASTVAAGSRLALSDMKFLAGNRQISLVPSGQQVVGLAGAPLTIVLPRDPLLREPAEILVTVAGSVHRAGFERANSQYVAEVSFPPIGVTPAYVQIDYGVGERDIVEFNLRSLPYGNVTAGGTRLSGVTITLLNPAGARVALEPFGEANPYSTNANGFYGWMVPNGQYSLTAVKEGYYERRTLVFPVTNNVVNVTLDLVLKPPALADVIDPEAPLAENIRAVAQNVGEKVRAGATRLGHTVAEARNNPTVQQTAATMVVPAVVGTTAVGVVSLVSLADVFPLLRLLFLEPLLLLGLRRRHGWGQVYNALNKLPVDLVTLRLINTDTGRVVQTKVTDQKGRYAFVANAGRYRIEVAKQGMIFPSALLAKHQNDGRRPDIYHGEIISVSDASSVITANIPLDPRGEHRRPLRLWWQQLLRAAQVVIAWVGFGITLFSLYLSPRWYVWALAGIHVLFLVIFWRLALPLKVKSWGIVYDADTEQPVGRTVARLFNAKFNKLVSTQITDHRGRYYFLAGDDEYYVTYEHGAYQPHQTETIDLSGKDIANITIDVGLKKPVAGRPESPATLTSPEAVTPPAVVLSPSPIPEGGDHQAKTPGSGSSPDFLQ